MNTKKDRLEQVYEYVRMKFNIHTKTDFADALKITRPALSAAMNGNEAYLTKNLFMRICGAFPNTFNHLVNKKGRSILPFYSLR